MADLCRVISKPHELDFMTVSSYGGGTVSLRDVKILKDLDGEIRGKDVLVVEDIIDSGAITANYWLSEIYDAEVAEAHRSAAIHLHDLSMLVTLFGIVMLVSVSNLQRQVLYSEAEVGMPKAIQAKKRLEALNHDVQINAYPTRLTKENADEIIRTYDIIIDGCDNFATRYLINDICVKWGKVYVYGAIRAFEGQVSVFNYQGGPDYRHFFPDETEMLSMPHPPKGVLGVIVMDVRIGAIKQ